jgi:hypothetical protein
MKLQAPTQLFAYDQAGKRICRLCFGSPIQQRQVQRAGYTEMVHDFLPTQLFGVVWWNRRYEGQQHRMLAVLEALETSKLGTRMPDISAKVLVHTMLQQEGPAGSDGVIDRFLLLLDQVRDSGSEPHKLPSVLFQMMGHHIELSQRFSGKTGNWPQGSLN